MTNDTQHLKIMIFSCPKTGNAWLRYLLMHAYGVPSVALPSMWTNEAACTLPDTFVTHQHLWPSMDLFRWIHANNVTVLTTVRHPADTLLSLFHFVKRQPAVSDYAAAVMAQDGNHPGRFTRKFASGAFASEYAISMQWAALGAIVVRYEDLLANPFEVLRSLCGRIAPVTEERLRAAVVLCRSQNITRSGWLDPQHIRTGISGAWQSEMPDNIVEVMQNMEPYKSACDEFGYSWERNRKHRTFDYNTIDPFRGHTHFDNGEPIGAGLVEIYFSLGTHALECWPDPTKTSGNSFWSWLTSPAMPVTDIEQKVWRPETQTPTLTNQIKRIFGPSTRTLDGVKEQASGAMTPLMKIIYERRPDLQKAFPAPLGASWAGYMEWFVGRAALEYDLPYAVIEPAIQEWCRYLKTCAVEQAS